MEAIMTPTDELADTPYDDLPRVAVLSLGADPAPGLLAVEAAGARATGPFAVEADEDWAELTMVPVLWLELGDRAADEHARAVLERVQTGAEAGRWSGVIAASGSHLDLLAARVTSDALHLVVDGSSIERAVALRLALARAAEGTIARVHEGGLSEVERLRRLTEEVGRIAQALAKMSGGGAAGEGAVPRHRDAERGGQLARSSQAVRAMVRARRLREQFFQSELFADPAWDMLLDLYAAHLDQHRVAVSSLCIASAVPATTALRWIKTLTDNGLFVRRADPTDGRRVFIELSQGTADAMAAYLSELERQAEGVAWNGPVMV